MEDGLLQWTVDAYRWLQRVVSVEFFASVQPVCPTDDFFPDSVSEASAAAYAMFDRIKAHAGMQDEPVRFALAEDQPVVDPGHGRVVMTDHELEAWLEATDDSGAATLYAVPALLNDPEAFVREVALELANYFVATVEEPPGGDDFYSHAVEFTAIALGFGIFVLNARWRRKEIAEYDGFSVTTRGVLSDEEALVFFAAFLLVNNVSVDGIEEFLERPIRNPLHRTLRVLRRADGFLESLPDRS